MYNFYSNKSNKYKQKYINSYKQIGGRYYDNRDFNYSRRAGYDGGYYDRNYNGGNWFSPPDLINQVFKNINNTNPDLLNTQIWKGQNVKNSKKHISIIGYSANIYFTFRFNWKLEDGPVLAYITTIREETSTEYMAGQTEHSDYRYYPVHLYIIECNNNNQCDNKYELDSDKFDKRILESYQSKYPIDSYLKMLNPYIDDDVRNFNKLRKGGYNSYERYRDDYPRRGGYSRYIDDYYSDSMHGGALGEFRKEINREIE